MIKLSSEQTVPLVHWTLWTGGIGCDGRQSFLGITYRYYGYMGTDHARNSVRNIYQIQLPNGNVASLVGHRMQRGRQRKWWILLGQTVWAGIIGEWYSFVWNTGTGYIRDRIFVTTVHPCEKVVGMFLQNQIWSRLLDINRLRFTCVKKATEEVNTCQISKRGYQQGLSDETLKKALCQICHVKFDHRIMEAVSFFEDEMRIFAQNTFDFTER